MDDDRVTDMQKAERAAALAVALVPVLTELVEALARVFHDQPSHPIHLARAALGGDKTDP